ncbi:Cof-type HAD-IIB family hydrolase [Evansella sp. AB-rgal1]|uniref:Cof-type HAD-IIB family hydrolase n=1 Tax=Evansella sp. AB-rgal1 TaxID=3242696 RepID=UPI00359E3C18
MTKKLIFFDIDGTLLDEEKNLPISTKQSIQKLKEMGHHVAIATGRAPFLFEEISKELDIDTYVSYNGQYCVVGNKEVFKNPLSKEELQKLTKFAAEKDHPLVFMDHEDMKSNIEFHPHIEESIATLKFDHPSYHPTYFEDRDIYQTLLFCTPEEEQTYVDSFGKFDFVRWHPVSTDVLPAGGSKAKGIQEVMKHFDVAEEDVYAFGDGLNDIEMLTLVKNSVAMGNAHESAKNAAKYVTKNVDEDGITHGLQMVGLL